MQDGTEKYSNIKLWLKNLDQIDFENVSLDQTQIKEQESIKNTEEEED